MSKIKIELFSIFKYGRKYKNGKYENKRAAVTIKKAIIKSNIVLYIYWGQSGIANGKYNV